MGVRITGSASARLRVAAVAAFALTLAVPTLCSAQAATPERPKYNALRFEEDWSFLRDYSGPKDVFDAIKYVPLNEDGSIWVGFGGQVRQRVEVWQRYNFAQTPGAKSNDAYLLSRLRFYTDLHLTKYLRLFAEGKSSLSTDRDLPGGVRPIEEDQIDLQNGFVELKAPEAGPVNAPTFRAGRQELLFGRERLISPLDWTNTRRTFDTLSLSGTASGWKATTFVSHLVRIHKQSFNSYDVDTDFDGIYVTNPKVPVVGLLDLYYLYLDRNNVTFAGETGNEDRHTLGTRMFGPIGESILDYEVELDLQLGDVGGADVYSWSLASVLGATLPDDEWKPRLELSFDYAMGDDNPGDGDVNTFNQLFPLGHAYLGYIDYVGRQNIIHVQSMASIKPITPLTLRLDLHYFWRAQDEDALYNASGAVLRAGNLGTSRDVGGEIDLLATYAFDVHLSLVGGYSHFFAGEFIDQSGNSQDTDFIYVSVQYTL
jgi:hypothetical protein